MIESTQPAIPYYCSLHPHERGLIVILPEDEDKMIDIQKLSFLDSIVSSLFFDNENREIVTHLQRQIDPTIVEYLSKPNAVLLQNKVLTIVFWDISGFSNLCEKLDHSELIAEFLKEYLEIATRIIHEYGGIVDKFIGDGILAYFGFKENNGPENNGPLGAENAILAALKLKKPFEEIKNNWIEIWKKVIDSDIHIDIKCG
jgi:hypothetical protein